jgi:hypothetical protein
MIDRFISNTQQLSIFDIFDDLEKENRIPDVLAIAKEFNSNFVVAAVYIPSSNMPFASCSFVALDNGEYKRFMILHGHVVDRSHPLISNYPDSLNKHWVLV